ncbi:hypothetical protein ACE2AJ_14310 [Aquihabitans daechungensis]|uniref:hypothetical protein n=1 Tax=Aquihabitans daechungensis TaxID=1052257 RepID=UPI003BA0B921
MTFLDTKAYGERFGDLLPAFGRIAQNWQNEPEGSLSSDTTLPPEEALPLERALLRAEAELLLEEADELANLDAVNRTRSERRYDALMRVIDGFKLPPEAAAIQHLRID